MCLPENTAIAVRGTEVIGTVGGGAESVILISGQVDLVSIGGDFVSHPGLAAVVAVDMFGIGADGGLEFNADVVAAPLDYCNCSLVRAGFGVQVAGGQIATPGRIDTATIDAVIDAITIKESIEETSQQHPALTPAEEEAAEAGLAETGETSQSGDAATEPELATAEPEAEIEPAVLPVQETAGAAEPSPEAEESLSEFDKVVMRAFGLSDEEKPASEAVGDARSETQGQLVMAAGLAAEGPDDDDKADGAVTEDSGQNEVKLDDQVEDTPTEEEKRNEIKVEEAVLERTSPPVRPTAASHHRPPTPIPTPPTTHPLSPRFPELRSATAPMTTASLVSATLTGSDSNSGDTLTYSVSGGSADTSVSGFTHSRTRYGTLYVNSSSGAYRYVPNDSAIEALTSNASRTSPCRCLMERQRLADVDGQHHRRQ